MGVAKEEVDREQEEKDKIRNLQLWAFKEEERELQGAVDLERERRGDERFLEMQRRNWEIRKQILEKEEKRLKEEEEERNRQKKLWDDTIKEVELKKKEER